MRRRTVPLLAALMTAALSFVAPASSLAHGPSAAGAQAPSIAPGRATLMQGTVHLAIFGAFLFLAVTP